MTFKGFCGIIKGKFLEVFRELCLLKSKLFFHDFPLVGGVVKEEKEMKKRLLAAIVAGTMLLSATPVFGADDELLTFDVTPVEMLEEDVLTADSEPELVEEVVSENEISVDKSYKEQELEEADTAIMKVLEEDFIMSEEVSVGEISADRAGGSSSFVYYSQCAWQCKAGYDVIAAYVKSEDGKYLSRMFFIHDKEHEGEWKDWLRYDYSKSSAETFLTKWEAKDSNNGNTMYVPVEATSGGKKVVHADNPKTAINESKIPIIAEKDLTGINYAWKELSEVPFVKNGGAYEYAGEGKQDPEPSPEPDPKPEPEPTPTPVEGDRTAETDINGHHYVVTWTGAVQYDDRAHVWNQTNVPARNAAKQVADLKVEILCDGTLVDVSNYTVTCRNNINITGMNGNSKNQPYFSITLKGEYKKDNAAMSRAKLAFDITPCPVTDGKFQAKKVVIQGSKPTFTDLYFVFNDGRKVKLGVYNDKRKTGGYTAVGTDEGVKITGYNNLSGEGLLSMDNPKKVTYEW